METAIIPDTFNISITHVLLHPAIITLLLAVSVVPSTSLTNEITFILSVTNRARGDTRVLNNIPHAFRVEVTRVGSNPAVFTTFGTLTTRSELASRITITGDVGSDAKSRIVFAATTADIENTIPFAHGTSRASRRFRSPVASFTADVGLRVPFAIGVEATSINISSVENIATSTASISGVVEDAESRKSKAHGSTEGFALLTANSIFTIPHTSTISIA